MPGTKSSSFLVKGFLKATKHGFGSMQSLPELLMKMAEGTVKQQHGAVDEMAATATGQHGTKAFQGIQVGDCTFPCVYAIQQAAHGCGAGFARGALSAGGMREETHVFGHTFDDTGAFRNNDHGTRTQAAAARAQ